MASHGMPLHLTQIQSITESDFESVSDGRRCTIGCHAADFFELVGWSEQFRLVTSIWLGAIHHRLGIWFCACSR